jgi:hypothetical protein
VCRIIGEPEPAIHLAYGVGEQPTARHHQQSTVPRGSTDRRECGVEMTGVREDASAELHHDLDTRSVNTLLGHAHGRYQPVVKVRRLTTGC